jgi:hypothetical protein
MHLEKVTNSDSSVHLPSYFMKFNHIVFVDTSCLCTKPAFLVEVYVLRKDLARFFCHKFAACHVDDRT